MYADSEQLYQPVHMFDHGLEMLSAYMALKCYLLNVITKTCLYNFDPLVDGSTLSAKA